MRKRVKNLRKPTKKGKIIQLFLLGNGHKIFWNPSTFWTVEGFLWISKKNIGNSSELIFDLFLFWGISVLFPCFHVTKNTHFKSVSEKNVSGKWPVFRQFTLLRLKHFYRIDRALTWIRGFWCKLNIDAPPWYSAIFL